ncbi:MAG: SufD family Fe-S cluster assembly protein [Candidatus Omnitrophota bacterium]|nr:MAG: SufD family Fe-S cluster assembly protein [Candidatus Omnitrophota bacterium]
MNLQKIKRLAAAAKDKKSIFGEDIDLENIETNKQLNISNKIHKINPVTKKNLLYAGIDLNTEQKAGEYLQIDNSVSICNVKQPGIEVMEINQALEKYVWLKNYFWNAVKPDTDKYTAKIALSQYSGYFIWAKKGVKTIFPVQTGLCLGHAGSTQYIHNIIIAEQGAKLQIINGCTTNDTENYGLHLAVSEFYVQKNAEISFTMIHNFGKNVNVRPRSNTIVKESGIFISNYLCLRPVKSIQAYPTTYLIGKGAAARHNTILAAEQGTNLDIGAKVILKAPETKAELISRAITTGGNITARGQLVGEICPAKAHLECRGLLLANQGTIYAVPELIGKTAGIDLSHEAAVGKIAQEEIEYLMARGMTKDAATATIVRGFLNVGITGLPDVLKIEMDNLLNVIEEQNAS